MGGRFKLLKDARKGANVYIIEGQLNDHATRQRTQAVTDVIAMPARNAVIAIAA